MGKRPKIPVRAQRKFAQGVYVRPQSTAPYVGCAVNASHRAVSAPGRVTKNVCSAKDLLTRMSLGKAHPHTINWPIVLLEDCANLVYIEPDKKKLAVKKKHNRKHASDVDRRHSSVSDSGEDTPLSHLQNPPVTPSKQVKNVPVEDSEGTASRTTKTDIDKASDPVNLTSEKKKTKPIGLDKCVKVIVQPLELRRKIQKPPPEPPKRRLLKRNTKSYCSSLPYSDDQSDKIKRSKGCATRSRPHSNNAAHIPCSTKIQRSKRKVTQAKSHLKSHNPSFTHKVETRRPVSTSKKNSENDFLKKLADDPTLRTPCSTKNIQRSKRKVTRAKSHLKSHNPSFTHKVETRQPVSTSKKNSKNDFLKKLADDPTLPAHTSTSTGALPLLQSKERENQYDTNNEDVEPCMTINMTTAFENSRTNQAIEYMVHLDDDDDDLLNPLDTTKVEMDKYIMDPVKSEASSEIIDNSSCKSLSVKLETSLIHPKPELIDLTSLDSVAVANVNNIDPVQPGSITNAKSCNDLDMDPVQPGATTNAKSCNNLELDHSSCSLGMKLETSLIHPKPEIIDLTSIDSVEVANVNDIDPVQPGSTTNAKSCQTDNVVPAASVSLSADSIDKDSEASTSAAESRFAKICLTPLPEVPGSVGNQVADTNTEQARPEVPGLDGTQEVDTYTEQAQPEVPGLDGNQEVDTNTEQAQPEVPGLDGNQEVDSNTEQAQPEPPPPLPEVLGFIGNQAVDTNAEQAQPEQPLSSIRNNQPKPRLTLRDALVLRPTLEEFKDPIKYIKSIEPKASKYGMCKIIPPDGFHVPCHLDETCMFGTTNQHLSRLYHRWGPNSREFAAILTCLTSLTPRDKERFTKAPLFGGVEVDLVKLYHLVLKHGGIEGYLAHTEKWARIAAQMNLSACSKSDWKKLQNIYCKHVLPYESLTLAERQAAVAKADEIWKIRVKNAILRARKPLHYQDAMLSDSNLPEYEEAFPDADLADLYNICKPIYDKIEECTGKGRAMNLATFRRISAHVQGMRFPNGLPSTIAEIERQYWEILNLRDEHVCVLSAFIDTSVNKLGHESDPKAPGGSHPWNLKRIGENPKNILCSLGKTLSVTVPTLCLNQLFSTNSWHKDPHKMAWIDYLHEGAPKIWYSVPDSGAPAFRRAVQRMTEASVQDKGIWLASDTTMIPPGNLVACGVPVHRIEQNPNEYIVVFPGAYASSISTGLSVAESIYLVTDSWLDRVEEVFEEMHKDCEPAMFSCVLLMMNMARNPTISSNVLQRVFTILKRFIKNEFQARREAQWLNCKVTTDKRGREEGNLLPVSWPNQEECCLCRMPLVLSKMSKYDEPRKQMCITHGTQYMRLVNGRPEEDRPELPPVLTLHYTNQELIEVMGTMELYTSKI